MKIQQPFHIGEIEVQELVGERDAAILNGRLYEDSIMVPAHKFLSQLSFLVISSEAEDSSLPISFLFGPPGFLQALDNGKRLAISLASHDNLDIDPALKVLRDGKRIGALAIDLSTRKRLRINGKVTNFTNEQLVIEVDESYPNCPKYIQKRTLEIAENQQRKSIGEITQGSILTSQIQDLIRKADTFFVSSLNPTGHADASHRGGLPGFINIIDENRLAIPDYAGNSLFNTFGNFKINSQAGIVVWDFEQSAFLHLFGHAELNLHSKNNFGPTGGTGRWWYFQPKAWIHQKVNLPFIIKFHENSPFNPDIGSQ